MKKEKIFVNKIAKKINNNQNYCDVKLSGEDYNYNIDIDNKIDELFNSNGYVFNKDVKIIANNRTYQTRIAGKVNNHLITMDNDIIDISSIKDIVY